MAGCENRRLHFTSAGSKLYKIFGGRSVEKACRPVAPLLGEQLLAGLEDHPIPARPALGGEPVEPLNDSRR